MTEQMNNPTTDVNGDGNKPGASGRTFTQSELDEIVRDRLARQGEKFKDYGELKAAAQNWQQLQEQQKSEEQKLREALDKANSEKATAIQTANLRLIEAAFITEATIAGVKYPRDAYLLAQADKLPFELTDTGEASGVKEAVQKLLQSGRLVLDKPHAPNLDGGAGGGERATDKAAVLTDEEKAIAKKMGLSEADYAKAKGKK